MSGTASSGHKSSMEETRRFPRKIRRLPLMPDRQTDPRREGSVAPDGFSGAQYQPALNSSIGAQ